MKTLIQKLLEDRIGKAVDIGDILEVPVDLAWGSEITSKFAIDILEENNFLTGKYDKNILSNADKVMFPFDHLVPATDARSASLMVDLRNFADKYKMRVFEVGFDGGIQHRLFEERGFLYPGAVGIGADSHTCTYGALSAIATGVGSSDLAAIMLSGKVWLKVPSSILIKLIGKPKEWVTGKDVILQLLALQGSDGASYQSIEYCGEGLKYLNMASRFTISNMAIEGGAKFGLFPTDDITIDYLINTVAKNFPDEYRFDIDDIKRFTVDEDANYTRKITIDLSELEPMVALPYCPDNVIGIHQLKYILDNLGKFNDNKYIQKKISSAQSIADEDGSISVQQVFIGSCTNGRIEDLRIVAKILANKRVAKGVRAVIVPASQQVYRQALKEGLVEILLDAGCYIESSSCGPCIGMKSGVLGKHETAIFTSNRNFYGRTGDKKSHVILASPAVAAFSALQGKLTSPKDKNYYYESDDDIKSFILNMSKAYNNNQVSTGSKLVENVANRHQICEAYQSWVFNDNVNTDLIMPSRYCNVTNPQEYKKFLLRDAKNEGFLKYYEENDFDLSQNILVAGKNFGCGSSRESAPMAIKVSGIKFVVAHSFARIFFRNAVNIGLLIFELRDLVYTINESDKLYAELETGKIVNLTQNKQYSCIPMGGFQKHLYLNGGLLPSIKEKF